jgi:CheY-like chemotaxis protein
MLDEGGRHHYLSHLRTPLEKRKKSIIGGSRGRRRRGKRRVIKILHVDDYRLVADAVRDTLEALGWKVETCASGAEAMKILDGDEPYHVFTFDYELPGRNEVELTRHARTLPQPAAGSHHVHRQRHRAGGMACGHERGLTEAGGLGTPVRDGRKIIEQRHDGQRVNPAGYRTGSPLRVARLPSARSLEGERTVPRPLRLDGRINVAASLNSPDGEWARVRGANLRRPGRRGLTCC